MLHLHSPNTPTVSVTSNGTTQLSTDPIGGPPLIRRSTSKSPQPPRSPNDQLKISASPRGLRSSWLPGSQVVAQYNFAGSSPEDLPFAKGQILQIVATTADPNWYMASHRDVRGLIPVNYVIPYDAAQTVVNQPSRIDELRNGSLSMIWFHGKISREQTEVLLADKPDGTFLIRESTNFPGDYTLCLAYAAKVEHYRIQRIKGMLTCDEEEYFDTLTQLVSHYKRDADGLCHRLIVPLPNSTVSSSSTASTSTGIGHDEADMVVQQTKVFKTSGWCIHRHELSLGDTIGHGEFGDVLIGWFREEKVAVKVLKHCSGVVESLLEEAALMTSLRHQNLVRLLGVVLDDLTDVFMVTEFMANGNLVDYLRSRGRHQVDKQMLLQFAIDVCDGMAYLESRQLVHRDLAARNVLLSEQMMAKISDFGLAKHADTSSLETSGKFPIKWTAPEALRHSQFTNKSDMWSFGILLWEIYSFGRVPYPRIPIQDVIRHIEKGYRMEPPEACPKCVAVHMTAAWGFRPEERPPFSEMLERLRKTKLELSVSAPTPTTAPPPLRSPPKSPVPPVVTQAISNLTVNDKTQSSSAADRDRLSS